MTDLATDGHEPIEGELVPYVPSPSAAVDLFGANDPVEVIARAQKVAGALKDVLTQQGLTQRIGKGEHVLVSGWTLLGSMLGVFPVEDGEAEPVEIDGVKGFRATVKAVTRKGEVVGRATAYCMRDEKEWGPNPTTGPMRKNYALASMAQTRATSKALRQPLGFVVTLAGYSETPAEEMPARSGAGAGASAGEMITDAQHRKIGVLLKEAEAVQPTHEGQLSWVAQLREEFKVVSRKDMTKEQASKAIEWLETQIEAAQIPFG